METVNRAFEKGIKKNTKTSTLTIKTIENARKGIGLDKPIKNISNFVKSL